LQDERDRGNLDRDPEPKFSCSLNHILAIAFLPKSFPRGVVNHDADSNDNHKTKKYESAGQRFHVSPSLALDRRRRIFFLGWTA
jgi:hypothetical protein